MRRLPLPATPVLWLVVASVLLVACERATDSPAPAVPFPDLSAVTEDTLLRAVREAQAKVEQAPDSAADWAQLGHVYLVHSWPTEAAQCYERAAELSPKEARLHYFHGLSLEKTDAAGAVAAFERAAAIEGRYPPFHTACARALRQLNRLTEARRHLERAAELDPRNPYAHLGLGQIALAERRFADARVHLERALQINPGQSEAHQAMAQVAFALGDHEAARKHTEAAQRPTSFAAEQDPLGQQVTAAGATRYWAGVRAFQLVRAGDYEHATVEFEKAAQPNEPSPMFWYNFGDALRLTGQADRAIAAYQKALEVNSSHREYALAPEQQKDLYNNLALAHIDAGDHASAEAQLREAIAIDPEGAAQPLYNLCLMLEQQGRFEEALGLLASMPEVGTHPTLRVIGDRLAQKTRRSPGSSSGP